MALFRTCGICTLRTGSYAVAVYTFILVMILLSFNIPEYITASDYLDCSRVISLIASCGLLIAALCLVSGVRRRSPALHLVWLILFGIYMIFQIMEFAYKTWFFYADNTIEQPVHEDEILETLVVPPSIKTSIRVYVVVGGIFTILNYKVIEICCWKIPPSIHTTTTQRSSTHSKE